MEACGSSHYWARELAALGQEMRLIPPIYVKHGKNDAADAAANHLHWVLDVVFHDDLARLRTENRPANMATFKHAALHLIKEIPDKASLEIKKKTVAWDEDYLFRALTQPWR